MMIYKDMTFCEAGMNYECGNTDCYRYLTERDRSIIKEMNIGVSISDFKNNMYGLHCEYFKVPKRGGSKPLTKSH